MSKVEFERGTLIDFISSNIRFQKNVEILGDLIVYGSEVTNLVALYPSGIETDTIDEYTTGAGVTIDGCLIKDGKVANSDKLDGYDADHFVAVTGDTMTGMLTIQKTSDALELRGTSDGASNATNTGLKLTEEGQLTAWYIVKRGSSYSTPNNLHITYYNGSSWVAAIDIEPEGRIGVKRDIHPVADATYDLGDESYRFARGYFSYQVFVGTAQSGSNRGILIRGDGGNIELWRGDDGVPYIDFKTDYATDYDCRIQKTADHGLEFKVGGAGSTKTAFLLDDVGFGKFYNYLIIGDSRNSIDQLYIRRPTNGTGYQVGLNLQFYDSANNWTNYAGIYGRIANATDGNERGCLDFYTIKDGNWSKRWYIDSLGHYVPATDNTYNIGWANKAVANIYAYTYRTPPMTPQDTFILGEPVDADSSNTTRDSPAIVLRGKYWDGSQSQNDDWKIYIDVTSTPGSNLSLKSPENRYFKFHRSGTIGITVNGSVNGAAIYVGDDVDTGLYHPATDTLGITCGGSEKIRFGSDITTYTNFVPDSDNARNIGSASYRFANIYCVNIYSGDINMENGWRFTEHPEYGVVLVSPEGKTYKFVLEEINN